LREGFRIFTMQRVADLTVAELRFIIQETVREAMRETDPDAGLELSDETKAILSQPASKEGRISIQDLVASVGLKW
jgi:16S rRNA C967 or C1407 C5-methylase (RsmB/RsmF family)